MAAPFYAQYAAEYGPAADFADIAHQFTLVAEKARDPETGLLYHAWNEDRRQAWANPDTCSPHFWGRAMGWYCMAIVDGSFAYYVGEPVRVAVLERERAE